MSSFEKDTGSTDKVFFNFDSRPSFSLSASKYFELKQIKSLKYSSKFLTLKDLY